MDLEHWIYHTIRDLTGSIPSSLGKLINLKILMKIVHPLLDGKAFTGEIPSTLELVESLEAFDEISPVLYSLSEPPLLFDGTRLYSNLACPYGQRV
ncbi:hypothetical protein SUGI_0530650 [Cryptomeria japonica]|nr:hypothetical protein SUGI_0530650 [Cryptomeria japonica]